MRLKSQSEGSWGGQQAVGPSGKRGELRWTLSKQYLGKSWSWSCKRMGVDDAIPHPGLAYIFPSGDPFQEAIGA